MFKIIQRDDAVLLAIRGKDVYQVDLEYLNVMEVEHLAIDEIVEHKNVFYVVKEKDND